MGQTKRGTFKIGILSDTHTKTKRAQKAIEQLVREGAQYLIHAGDIVELEILKLMEETALPYVAVLGNNDAHLINYKERFNLVREPHYFTIGTTHFKLMHLPFYFSADADVVIYGHTHEFYAAYTGKSLFLNPGEVCARNKNISECALLEITEDFFAVDYWHRTIKTAEWKSKRSKFLR